MKTKILISVLTLACLLAMSARAQVNYAVSGGSAYVTSGGNASGNIAIASTCLELEARVGIGRLTPD